MNKVISTFGSDYCPSKKDIIRLYDQSSTSEKPYEFYHENGKMSVNVISYHDWKEGKIPADLELPYTVLFLIPLDSYDQDPQLDPGQKEQPQKRKVENPLESYGFTFAYDDDQDDSDAAAAATTSSEDEKKRKKKHKKTSPSNSGSFITEDGAGTGTGGAAEGSSIPTSPAPDASTNESSPLTAAGATEGASDRSSEGGGAAAAAGTGAAGAVPPYKNSLTCFLRDM